MIRRRREFMVDIVSAGLVGSHLMACSHQPLSAAVPPSVFELNDRRKISRRLWPSTEEGVGAPVSLAERANVPELISLVAQSARDRGSPPDLVRELARESGFVLEVWQLPSRLWWALVEGPGPRRGLGAYVFRVGKRSARRYQVIQSPHSFHDIGTGRIAIEMILSPDMPRVPDALFVNTLHRYQGGGPTAGSAPSSSDVCHQPDHIFSAVLASLAETEPELDVVQIHGCADRQIDNPKTGEASAVLAVLSAGAHRQSESWVKGMSQRLHKVWGDGVRLFPDEVNFLGGMNNVQGRLLSAYAESRFVHVELAASARKRRAHDVAMDLATAFVAMPKQSE